MSPTCYEERLNRLARMLMGSSISGGSMNRSATYIDCKRRPGRREAEHVQSNVDVEKSYTSELVHLVRLDAYQVVACGLHTFHSSDSNLVSASFACESWSRMGLSVQYRSHRCRPGKG